MVQPVTTPFSAQPVKPVKFAVPPDLAPLISAAANVKRLSHPDYPAGMRADNVRDHTLRLVHATLTIELPAALEAARPNLARALWLHDLPEIPTAAGQDVSAVVQHDDPALARRVEAQELQTARRLFAPTDLLLYMQFESARHVLAGRTAPPRSLPPAAYIARVLDIGDGETGFYHFLSSWIRDPGFDGTMPTSRPYEFTLSRYQALNKLLPALGFDPHLSNAIQALIADQTTFILRTLQPLRHRLPPAGHQLIDGL